MFNFCYLFNVFQFLTRFVFHLLFVYVYVLVQVMARRIAVGSSKSLQHMVEQAVVRCGLELQSVANFTETKGICMVRFKVIQ